MRPDPWVNVLPSPEKWQVIKRVLGVDAETAKRLDECFAEAEREVTGRADNGIAGGTGKHAGQDGSYGFKASFDITAPATAAAQEWAGWGSALKPAYEIAIVARKPLDIVSLSGNIEAWLLNFDASSAERHSESSNVELPPGSAPWVADPSGDSSDPTGTSLSAWATTTYLSIASSWRNISVVICELMSMSTTETTSSLTTDLKTLNSCLSRITRESITVGRITLAGSPASVEHAVRSFNAVASKWAAILTLSAPDPAISLGQQKRRGASAPKHEPVILARKPLDGTLAANALKHRTGGLNVDGCRVAAPGEEIKTEGHSADAASRLGIYGKFAGKFNGRQSTGQMLGRWPPNLLLCHAPGCQRAGADKIRGHKGYPNGPGGKSTPMHGWGKERSEDVRPNAWVSPSTDADGMETVERWACVEGCPVAAIEAQAGAGQARFFPQFEADADDGIGVAPYLCPKASRAEREAGCEALPGRTGAEATHREEGTAAMASPRTGAGRTAGEVKNWHPTVKPVGVMRWLCRLLVAPGGRVLDPFMGSGTTGIAAGMEGFDFVGIEMDEGHMRIAEARIAHHTGKRAEEPPPPPAGAPGEQMSLFAFSSGK